MTLPLIAAVGLDFEAAAARGEGVELVCGLNRGMYLGKLHEKARAGAKGIISFGVAGGLSPDLRAGDVVIASSVLTAGRRFETCEVWSKSLLMALPRARYSPVFGSSSPLLTVPEKRLLWSETGSATVDMESRDAAEVAADYGLPYAVLRVVLDAAHRTIPRSALAGADDEGKTCAKAVAKALARRPEEWHAMVRIANDARKANRSLHSSRQALGPFFAFDASNNGDQAPAGDRPCERRAFYGSSGFRSGDFLLVWLPRWLAGR